MSATDICRALGNAARSAEECAKMALAAKKQDAATAQSKLAAETWALAGWWANICAAPVPEDKHGS